MKKIAVALLLPVIVFGQSQNGFEIRGNIKGLKDSTKVILVNGTDGKTVASAVAVNGTFTLKGSVAGAEIFQIAFADYKDAMDLYMQNEQVTITGDASDIPDAVVHASSLQDDYAAFKKRFSGLKDKLNRLAAQVNQETDQAKKNSLIIDFTKCKNEVVTDAAAFVKEKPASQVSAFVIVAISPLFPSIDYLESQYNELKASAKTGTYARMIQSTISNAKANAQVGAIGTQALPFSQKDTANKLISLASFKGQYVLVDFWASWCRPCRAENPNVVKAFNEFKGKNFTVLGVSLDQDKGSWLQAIKADKLTWTHVSDLKYWSNEVAQLYHIQSIPSNMLIDPNGKIIGRDLREEELHKKLREVLK